MLMFSPADGADSHRGISVSAEVFTCTGSFILIFSEVALRIFNWSPSVNWHQPGITVGGLSQPSPCTKWKYTPDGVRAHYRTHNSHWGEFTAGLSNVQPAYDPPHTAVHTPQVQQDIWRKTRTVIALVFVSSCSRSAKPRNPLSSHRGTLFILD